MEEKMVKIKHNLEGVQDRKKSYADISMTVREFKVGEHVFLKVKPKKNLIEVRQIYHIGS
jgi:ribosomal protein L21E